MKLKGRFVIVRKFRKRPLIYGNSLVMPGEYAKSHSVILEASWEIGGYTKQHPLQTFQSNPLSESNSSRNSVRATKIDHLVSMDNNIDDAFVVYQRSRELQKRY